MGSRQLGLSMSAVLTASVAITAMSFSASVSLAASQSHEASTSSAAVSAAGTAPEILYPVQMDVSPPLVSVDGEVDQNGDFSFKGKDRGQLDIPNGRRVGGQSPSTGSPTAPAAPAVSAPTPGVNFDGVGVGLGSYAPCCAPPDPNGAVGPNHYVQTVNLDFAIFNKTGGAPIYGPVKMNTIFAGFGGGCQTNNDGDPIVVYDQMADRWVISQFSVTTTPYLQCVAVSTSADPTGSYFRYAYDYGTVDFPDYPKIGVWPDAYYATYNIFANGTTFSGSEICAWDRAKMLAGAAATQQCFKTSNLYGGLLPSNLDGRNLPPAGAANYVVGLDTSTTLVSWKFHVDWATPANSTFTGPTSLTVQSYNSSCATASRGACIPQGGTTQKLESLADRLMYRLAYRNFGDHEALVVNHTIEVGSGSTLHSGVRWYELRPVSGNLTLFQQGTYSPDNNWRWMGSAAMDGSGNMAIGYSVSSSTVSPQIHYTGRLATDAAGTMSQGENVIINGGGSQTGGLARWGDYSSLSVDPVDDCTFWYTNEYLRANGSFNWSTRIASFKLPACGAPDFSVSATPSSQTVIQGSSTAYTATVTPTGGFTGTVTLGASGLPAGATATFNPASVTASGSSTMTVATATTTPTGSYVVTITGTSGALVHSTTVTLVVNAPATPDFTLSATPASQPVVQGASTSYTATVTATGGFTGTVSFSASGLPAGASASFNPTSVATSGSSTMTVATATTTPTGAYPLTITGTSGTLSHTATVNLVVNPPGNFTLTATPTSRTINRGSSTTYSINIARTSFTSGVTFSVTGFGAGASGAFNPNPATGASSTLTVTTTSAATTGTFTLTVTGTGGGLTRTVNVTLVLNAPCTNGNCQN